MPGQTRTENGVYDVVRRLDGGGKIINERDFEIFQLLCESLRIRSATCQYPPAEERSHIFRPPSIREDRALVFS